MWYNKNRSFLIIAYKLGGQDMKIQIPEEVRASVMREENINRSKEWYKILSKMVSGKQAVSTFVDGLDEKMAKMVSSNSDEIKVLPVKNNSDKNTGYFAIFNLAEIEGREQLDQISMEVPKGKEGLILGSGKWQVSEWVRNSWLRKLHVTKIWVKGV